MDLIDKIKDHIEDIENLNNEEDAFNLFIKLNGEIVCPYCCRYDDYTKHTYDSLQCNKCSLIFNVKKDTIFEDIKLGFFQIFKFILYVYYNDYTVSKD
jgi:hypothetical protein